MVIAGISWLVVLWALFDCCRWTGLVTQPVQRTPFGLLLGCLLLIRVEVPSLSKGFGRFMMSVFSLCPRQDALQLDESFDAGGVSRAWLVWSGAAEAALSEISFMRLLFIDGMRFFGSGGIGFGKTPWCILKGGIVKIWFPLLPVFSVSPISRLVVLVCFLILLGLMRNSERPDFPIFCRSGQREASLEDFDREVEGWLPLLAEVHLPRLTGQMLDDVVQRKSVTAGSLDGWEWRILVFGLMGCWMLTLP